MYTIFYNCDAVYKNMLYSCGVEFGIVKTVRVTDGSFVKDHKVSVHSGQNKAFVLHFQLCGCAGGHFSYSFFKRKSLCLTHIAGQKTRKSGSAMGSCGNQRIVLLGGRHYLARQFIFLFGHKCDTGRVCCFTIDSKNIASINMLYGKFSCAGHVMLKAGPQSVAHSP